MIVSERVLDTIDHILEDSDTIRLANQLGQDRDDWRTRALAAEALLAEAFADDEAAFLDLIGPLDVSPAYRDRLDALECPTRCGYCGTIGDGTGCEHTPDCVVTRARARAHLREVST
jgi:hypothetical protein